MVDGALVPAPHEVGHDPADRGEVADQVPVGSPEEGHGGEDWPAAARGVNPDRGSRIGGTSRSNALHFATCVPRAA